MGVIQLVVFELKDYLEIAMQCILLFLVAKTLWSFFFDLEEKEQVRMPTTSAGGGNKKKKKKNKNTQESEDS